MRGNLPARLAATVAAAFALGALLPGLALADETITAGPPNVYTTPNPTIDQGERLLFRNLDISKHDVTARAKGPDGRPLFSTPLIASGEETVVNGAQYLTAGRYDFFCTIHAGMEATLTVTSAGTPAARPLAVSLEVVDGRLGAVLRSGRLRVRARTSETASVRLVATTRAGRRTVTVATATAPVSGSRVVSMRLSSSGRRALAGRRRAEIVVSADARAGRQAARDRTRRTLG